METAQSGSPYLTIWTEPRRTIRQIVETNPRYRVIALIVVGGEIAAVGNLFFKPALPASNVQTFEYVTHLVKLAMLVVAPALALVSLYLGAVVFRWAGGLLGGIAKSVEVRAAIAWASIPNIVITVINTLGLATGMLHPLAPQKFQGMRTIVEQFNGLVVAELMLGIWAIVIWLKCLGEVHGFSAWKALGTNLIVAAVGIGAMLGLALTLGIAAVMLGVFSTHHI